MYEVVNGCNARAESRQQGTWWVHIPLHVFFYNTIVFYMPLPPRPSPHHLLSYAGTPPISIPTPPLAIFSISNPSISGGGLLISFPTPLAPCGPSPQTRYCMASPRSHVAWKMPHALNAQGTSPSALVKKNHILNESPTTQFAMTLGLKPAHPRRCQLVMSWGRGRVASTARAMAPSRLV